MVMAERSVDGSRWYLRILDKIHAYEVILFPCRYGQRATQISADHTHTKIDRGGVLIVQLTKGHLAGYSRSRNV